MAKGVKHKSEAGAKGKASTEKQTNSENKQAVPEKAAPEPKDDAGPSPEVKHKPGPNKTVRAKPAVPKKAPPKPEDDAGPGPEPKPE